MWETWVPTLLLLGLMTLAVWIYGRGELEYRRGYERGYQDGLTDGRGAALEAEAGQ